MWKRHFTDMFRGLDGAVDHIIDVNPIVGAIIFAKRSRAVNK
jgi:hypothetical protein